MRKSLKAAEEGRWTDRARRLLIDAASDTESDAGGIEGDVPDRRAGTCDVETALWSEGHRGTNVGAPIDVTIRIVVLLGSDGITQRTVLKELFNTRAHWLLEASDVHLRERPRAYRWNPGSPDVSLVQRYFATDAVMAAKLADSRAWRSPAFCRLLNGRFKSVSRSRFARELAAARCALRIQIVAHGETVDEPDPSRVRRILENVDAGQLAHFLVRNVFRSRSGRDRSGVMVDMVACALAVPGESLTDASSYVGRFLLSLAEQDPDLAERTLVVANTFAIGYPVHGFERGQRITISARELLVSESMLTQFGISHQFMAALPGAGAGRRRPIRISSVHNDFLQQEDAVLDAFVTAYEHWQSVGGWRAHALSSRFVLFELMSDLNFTLDHPTDIAIVQTFVERLQRQCMAPASVLASTPTPISPAGRHAVSTLFGKTASLRIAGGVIRLFGDREGKQTLAAYDFNRDIGLFGFTLFKHATSTHLIDQLKDVERWTLRRYLLTHVRLLDNGIYRWIGLPETGADFVARWRDRWCCAPGDSENRLLSGYMGGELFNALLRIAWMHGHTEDVRALASLTVPGGIFDASPGALHLRGFAEHAGVHAEASPLAGSTGAAVSPESAGSLGAGGARGGFESAFPARSNGSDGSNRPGGLWRVHGRQAGIFGCRPIARADEWETVFGRIGVAVGCAIKSVLMEADTIRWGLLSKARDAAARSPSSNGGTAAADNHAHDASTVWQHGLLRRASYFPCTRDVV